MNKIKEAILQKLERVARLLLEPLYGNRRISSTKSYSFYQQ